jgi:hypothetical protein
MAQRLSGSSGMERTSHTVRTQQVSAFDLTAAWALVQRLDILQGLAGHLTVTLLHVGGLLLGDGAEDGFPKIGEERGDSDGDWEGESEGDKSRRDAQGRRGEETQSHGEVVVVKAMIMFDGVDSVNVGVGEKDGHAKPN